MDKLFGTDGVRGVANADLTPQLAFRLGKAAVAVLAGQGTGGQGKPVIVGRDTRRSGDMLSAALAAGVASAGCDVHDVGIIPTPGAAYLTRTGKAAFGVMISASHNPPEDNGIKFFGGDGFKLQDEQEQSIERLVTAMTYGQRIAADGTAGTQAGPVGDGVGRIVDLHSAAHGYVDMLERTAPARLDGMRIVIDCANGAASTVGPQVLERLGAEVIALFHEPDGMNINVGCGSLHTEPMQEAVRRHGADAGISLDGDADRVIMADADGELVDGDAVLAMCGLHLQRTGRLSNSAIAATAYSNLGLRKTLGQNGIDVVETPPGDRSVMLAMREHGLSLGGEQSGHIIFLEHNTTGDGLLAALQVLGVMRAQNETLAELARCLRKVPLVLEAVPVRDKRDFTEHAALQRAIAEAAEQLQPDGRLFVRPSGTESVIRVLGEGDDEQRVRATVDKIVALIAAELA